MVTRKDILKEKMWMKKAQADAKSIMLEGGKIWDSMNWGSGSDVKDTVLKKRLKKTFGKKKFDPVVAEILEDANFHSENTALEELGLLTYKGDRLTKYKSLGGKTWEL